MPLYSPSGILHDSARNDAAIAFVVATVTRNAWLRGAFDTFFDARG